MTEIKVRFNGPARFPWRVGSYHRTQQPTIVDADGVVVAQLMHGDTAQAKRIVQACNRAAEKAGLEEA